MTFRIICEVKNNQVTLTLPADFSHDGTVTVLVNDQVDSKSKKLELLKSASLDPLFLADIKEIHDDFDAIDAESLKP
jgi:hypothetical protein